MTTSRRGFLTACGAWGGSRVFRASVAAAPPASDVPWLKEVQQPPDPLPDDAPTLSNLLVSDQGKKIDSLETWRPRRDRISQQWKDFLQPLTAKRNPPRLTVLKEDRPQGVVRQLVRYESEPGQLVEGYLLKPDKITGRTAGVVVFHSTVNHTIRQPAGVEGKPEKAFALKLARLGYVCFCPRCFLWQGTGSYQQHVDRFKKRWPRSKGMAKMLFDGVRALDVLESLPEVDSKRLGALGHSLGAKEALYLAALDDRVAAAVSSEGGIGMRFSNWDASWYLGAEIREPNFPRAHHELLALIAPRPFLLVGGDSADGDRSWPFVASALPLYDLHGQPRRVGLLNHKRGHSVPPQAEQRINAWLQCYLPPSA
ncbi:MAG: dienelactone hydrolase family protein [Planctomycetales bacterium]